MAIPCDNPWCRRPIKVMVQKDKKTCSQLCEKFRLGQIDAQEWERRWNAAIEKGPSQEERETVRQDF